MNVSKSRAQAAAPYAGKKAKKNKSAKVPELEEFLAKRDFQGAITLLQFKRHSARSDTKLQEWLAYSYYHNGEHDKALKIYEDLMKASDNADPTYPVYAGACKFYMGLFKEAEEQAHKGVKCPLQLRLLFHLSHKFGDETKLMQYHQQLGESIEDQLSLAAIHFLRSHFQEATDIYKRLLLDHRDYHALNLYVSLCYYKLDYYDVSLEILGQYLKDGCHPDSALAINLRACNHFRLYNGKSAENELKPLKDKSNAALQENMLIRHNLVVFRGGENSLRDLPPLVDIVPEARLNLVIYYLRNNDVEEAHKLTSDLEPSTPQEYILKGVVHTSLGQQRDAAEHLKLAQQYFQLVGASASECDTIPGRQCMASCFFLLKQFDDVLIFLQSIKTYFYNDDDFNWNYGIAKASVGKYKEAEEALTSIQSDAYRSEYIYLAWLARCYIMNGKPRQAWELYLRIEISEVSFHLLMLIANDCYRMGSFYYAAKAFDVLERLDPNPEYTDAKRGACIGVFQMIIAGKEPKDSLRDVLGLLHQSSNMQTSNSIRIMHKWAKDNGIRVTPA